MLCEFDREAMSGGLEFDREVMCGGLEFDREVMGATLCSRLL
jgi:hypothetical protein